jgi:hypothetical protein
MLSKNSKMGRPEHQPTAATRRRVSVCAGAGMSHEEIALGMGLARGTLEKHYEHELSIGAYQRRQEVIDALHKAALKGNVAAGKAYIAMTPGVAPPPVPPDEKAEPQGKKAQAQAEAQTAHLADPDWNRLLSKTPLQ